MSLATFASVLFKARMIILYVLRNTVTVLFGCLTGGIVSDLSPAHEDQISQLTFQQFFKEKK
jgi:hypothetical protein